MTNIIVGLQSQNTILITPYGGAEESAVNLGLIKGGVSIEHNEELHEINVDQFLGPVDVITTAEGMTIKTTLAEATLKNLAYALGYDENNLSSGVLTFGSKEVNNYYTLFINVKGEQGKLRKYTFWKCKLNGKTVQAYKKDMETVADVEFTVLTDTTKPSGARFGKAEDR